MVWVVVENYDFFMVGRWICFVFFFISGVYVSGVGGEFCCIGIYVFINWVQVILVVQFVDFCFVYVCQFCQMCIGKVFVFQLVQEFSVQVSDVYFCYFFFQMYQFFNLYQELVVNIGQVEYVVYRQVCMEGIGDVLDMFCVSIFQFVMDFG